MKPQLPRSPVSLTRRQFLHRTTVAAATGGFTFPFVGRVLGANERINVACIGVGGKGDNDSSDASGCGGHIVAICDVDQRALDKKSKQFANKFPGLKQFKDYRKMLDEIGKDIDAVTVSTPDHNHGVAAIRAMKMGSIASVKSRSSRRCMKRERCGSLPGRTNWRRRWATRAAPLPVCAARSRWCKPV